MEGKERLLRRLERRGVLRSAALSAALRRTSLESLVPAQLATFSHLDVPWPLPSGEFTCSPSLSVLLAELLEPVADDRIFLPQGPTSLLAGLVADLDAVTDHRPVDGYDKALLIDPDPRTERAMKGLVKDGGFIVRLRLAEGNERLSKIFRDGDAWVEMGLSGLRLPGGPPSFQMLLRIEGMEQRVWLERRQWPEDLEIEARVQKTWNARLTPEQASRLNAKEHLLLARKFFHLAYLNQTLADTEKALDLYEASLATLPTAEAYTFRSWVLGLEGRTNEAIEGCMKAIALDPDFGNPYNDIGAFLLEAGKAYEALEWFEKAKGATRYEPTHFPFVNAGRAHLILGNAEKARVEFEAALKISPDYEPAKHFLKRIGT